MAKTKAKSAQGKNQAGAVSVPDQADYAMDDQRRQMIAETAYFRALARGFHGGDPVDDWLAAEAEVNHLLPPAGKKQ